MTIFELKRKLKNRDGNNRIYYRDTDGKLHEISEVKPVLVYGKNNNGMLTQKDTIVVVE